MNEESLKSLLEAVRSGSTSVNEAVDSLRLLPYENLGFARLDHHRNLRTGFPEVVYCPGKTTEQIVTIIGKLVSRAHCVLATRAIAEVAEAVCAKFPTAVYHTAARVLEVTGEHPSPVVATHGSVLVVAAGTADIPVAEEAFVTATAMGSPVERLYDVGVAGIHRLLDSHHRLLDANVLIVVAGMEGALPSVVGGLVSRPVIAVPTSVGYGASFQGVAPLLTMLNSCAAGIGVVNIDNGFGAGYMAHLINRKNDRL